MAAGEKKNRTPPVPKRKTVGSENMSTTQMFIAEKLDEAKTIAGEAKSIADRAEITTGALSERIDRAVESFDKESGNLREWIKDVNTASTASTKELTEEIKKLNSNFAQFEEVKHNQVRIREELDGANDRLSAHVNNQAKYCAKSDTKLQHLSKSASKDYTNLESAILGVKTDIKTQVTELKDDMNRSMQDIAPTVLLFKFIKWLVSIIVIGSAVIWSCVQVYEWSTKNSGTKKETQPIQAIKPSQKDEGVDPTKNSTPD